MKLLSLDDRRRFAISRSKEERQAQLIPLLNAIEMAIDLVGWERARPVVEGVMGFTIPRRRGRWWRGINKRSGSRLLLELEQLPAQARLPLSQAGS